ncbi:MAG: sn-glycerol-1-phosphate dehydrogenase [Spirochaetales bacterium]|nr:sn-glycerol-1-phosphate dehydrogenase [Spirochaetales bacterium]
METKAIIIRKNALQEFTEGYVECFGHAQAMMIAEEQDHHHYALPILRSLQKEGVAATGHTFKRATFNKIFPLLDLKPVVPVFFGDDRLLSVGKRVSYKLNRSFAAIPTVLESPAITSPWRFTWPGIFVPSQPPTLLLVDTDLIKEPKILPQAVSETLFLLTTHGEAVLFGEENLRIDLHTLAWKSADEFFEAYLDNSRYSLELLAKALAQGGVADQELEYFKRRNRRVPVSLLALGILFLGEQLFALSEDDTVGHAKTEREELVRRLFLPDDAEALLSKKPKSFRKRPSLSQVKRTLETNLPSYEEIRKKLKEAGCITSVEEARCSFSELKDELLRTMLRSPHLGLLDYYDELGLLEMALTLLEGM